jgi:hypothetical protein
VPTARPALDWSAYGSDGRQASDVSVFSHANAYRESALGRWSGLFGTGFIGRFQTGQASDVSVFSHANAYRESALGRWSGLFGTGFIGLLCWLQHGLSGP